MGEGEAGSRWFFLTHLGGTPKDAGETPALPVKKAARRLSKMRRDACAPGGLLDVFGTETHQRLALARCRRALPVPHKSFWTSSARRRIP